MAQYIDETNLGNSATEAQARKLIAILEAGGWDVAYGGSLQSDPLTDEEHDGFDAAFYAALEKV